jgi:V8-like Glu-specific endopeptidase
MRKIIISLILALTTSCCHLFQLDSADQVDVGYSGTVYVQTAAGNCTGFAIGYDTVVTAAHCAPLPNVYMLYKDQVVLGSVSYKDDESDVAIIKTTQYMRDVIPLLPSTSANRPGSELTAIGYPFYSHGIISFEKGYVIEDFGESIVATGICLRGESGGPVLNSYGQVIGFCSMVSPRMDIYSDGLSHSHKDISLIVPIKKVLEAL